MSSESGSAPAPGASKGASERTTPRGRIAVKHSNRDTDAA